MRDGAKAGIAIAATAILFIAIAVGWYFWNKKRKSNKAPPAIQYPELAAGDFRGYEVETCERKKELEARIPEQIYELGPEHVPPKKWQEGGLSKQGFYLMKKRVDGVWL